MIDELPSVSAPILQMRSINKFYGQNLVLDNVNFHLKRGEIHALLGENGAGKTTLMSILRGITQPSGGQILIDDVPQNIKSPVDSSRLGIGMVHQHFLLIPAFTVEENLILAGQKSGFLLDKSTISGQAVKICERLGWKISMNAKVADLTVGLQQRVEILKALLGNTRIILFDEPTAVLTPNEVAELLDVLRSLRNEGKSLVFVSHKLSEVMSLCDRVTVLRKGKVVSQVAVADTNVADLALRMVGEDAEGVATVITAGDHVQGKRNLSVNHVFTQRYGKDDVSLSDITFDVEAGEILGVAGVDGNGQEELFEALAGVRKLSSGHLVVNGQSIEHLAATDLAKLGIAVIPPDRQRQGLALDLSIRDNLVLNQFQRSAFANMGFLSNKRLTRHANDLRKEFDIRTPDIRLPASSLSGGNQQKIIIARALSSHPTIVVAASPTRGLDVAATAYVHNKLRECASSGAAVILISTELDEIVALSSRIAVMYEGRIVATLPSTTSREVIGLSMGGKTQQSQTNSPAS
jgi:general nucleoside transport system ATP-binding protein